MKLPACNEYSKDKKRPHFLRFLGSGVLTLHNEIICAVPIISGFDKLTKNKFVKIGPYIFQKLDLTGCLFRKLAKIHNLYG